MFSKKLCELSCERPRMLHPLPLVFPPAALFILFILIFICIYLMHNIWQILSHTHSPHLSWLSCHPFLFPNGHTSVFLLCVCVYIPASVLSSMCKRKLRETIQYLSTLFSTLSICPKLTISLSAKSY